LGANVTFDLRLLREVSLVWQRLLAEAPGTTLYHRQSWIELIVRAYHLPIWLATLRRNETVVSGCLLARSKNPVAPRFVSLPFSDNCPILALDSEAADALLDALIAHPSFGTACEIRGVSAVPPWHTVECFVSWRLNFDRPLSCIERGLDTNFRRNLRRATQQTIKIDRGNGTDYVKRFYAMQLQGRRRLGLPPQPWRFFKLAQEIFAPRGDLDVWIARQGGEDLAAAVFLRDGDCIHYKWGARGDHGAQSSANHLLFWSAIEDFAGRASALDLGRTDVRNDGLMRFKKALGATASPLPYSYYPRVPAQASSEVLTGTRRLVARIWRKLPISATEMLGQAIYGLLA